MAEYTKELKDMSDNLVNVRLDIRELMTEVRSLKALQSKVDDHEARLTNVEGKVEVSNKRLSKIESVHRWLAFTVIGAVILSVMSIITTNGGGAN